MKTSMAIRVRDIVEWKSLRSDEMKEEVMRKEMNLSEERDMNQIQRERSETY